MSNHPDKFRSFISESTQEALGHVGSDLLTVQRGRFAGYIEREIPIPQSGFSLFVNYSALPEGYLMIGVSLDTAFNGLIIGQDSDFLPVAMRKYPKFAKYLQASQKLRSGAPGDGFLWMGIDRDPHDGAEITVVSSVVSVPVSIVDDAEALFARIRKEDVRAITRRIIDTAFEILEETSDPINPLNDTLALKWEEFQRDIRDPKKIAKFLLKQGVKHCGLPLVKDRAESALRLLHQAFDREPNV